MRVIRPIRLVALTLALTLGTSVAATSVAVNEDPLPVAGVTGTVVLDPPTSLGDFSAEAGVLQYRAIPLSGPEVVADDVRLSGPLEAVFNYDVHGSGTQPVPAWGTVDIDNGAWTGTFTGIRRHDAEPFDIHAFMIGSGPYEGLCAVLDIEAGADDWVIDGVIHPLPMGA